MGLVGRPLKLQSGSLANVPVLTPDEKLKKIREQFFGGFAPSEYISLSEWADKYRYLAQETSAEYGRWKTSRFPFLKRIMDCLSPQSRAKEVSAIKGAQLGFTEIMINWIMYIAERNPSPAVYIQGTIEAVKDFNQQKLEPAIQASPRMRTSLGRDKAAELADSALRKGFPGGSITMGGANSPNFLRSKSVQYAMVDEEDTFKRNIGGKDSNQGSPIAMLGKRLVNFPFAKMFRASTPTIKETSTIEPAFLAGSQEYYYLPCPFCNEHADLQGPRFVLEWDLIKYSDELDESDLPARIWCECPHCGGEIEEHHKTWMLEHGRWLSSKNSEHGELYEVGDVEYPSFHLSSFYSPLGFFGWRDAVKEWFDYKKSKDVNLLQVIVNQTWGKTYTAAGSDISHNWLYSRRETYMSADTGEVVDVPSGGLVLTAGVDVQDDRLEVEVVAWGLYDECWSVEYSVFWGATEFLGDRLGMDPNTGQPTVWRQLSDYLGGRWLHESGQYLPVECVLVDSGGHRGEQVHAFCRQHEHRRIYPSKGVPGWGKSKGYFTRPKRRTDRFQTLLFAIYPDELKDFVYQCLSIDQSGPGFCHFPDKEIYDSRYFKGLTAENKTTKIVRGRTVLYWDTPSGARNEPLDCRCMALAARHIYGVNLDQRAAQETPLAAPRRREPVARRVSPGF